MFDKSLIGHGVLALVSVVVAFTAWSSPSTTASPRAKPKLLSGNLGELNRVLWRETNAKGVETEVEVLKKDGDAIEVSVRQTGGDEPVPPRVFPGSAKASELFESLSSFEGERALGAVTESERETFGLTDEKAKRLSLIFDQKEVDIRVGSEAYGNRSYYVSPPSGDVFLVGSRVLSALRNGGGVLLDRRVIGVERDQIRRVVVRTAELERELVHRYPDDASKAYYADPADPDVRLDEATGWIDWALRLRTQYVVDTIPSGTPEVTLQVFGPSDVLASIELWAKNEEGKAYARSSRFEKTLEVNPATVTRLLDDAKAVLGAEGESAP